MSFNPLKEKGISLEKQIKSWDKLIERPYKRELVDSYTRCRQILLNGIEVECWNFMHNLLRITDDFEIKKLIADIRFIETKQQMVVNWLCPHNQSVLDTTLAYEQVAIDLTAWLSQNEPDSYVKETYDFGLLEDFDHLYRYSQFAYLIEGSNPNDILHYNTDVMFARPTQYHHNKNSLRIRNPYNKDSASIQTKANVLTLLSAEQQTHNFYSEHGFSYGADDLRKLYAEICDVEEEHVTMYETLIDSNETMLEKLLLREFMEVCCYHNCYKDEIDNRIKLIWEEFLGFEIEHLKLVANLYQKVENKDPESIIGDKIYDTCHFESQKNYVNQILVTEIDKRLNGKIDNGYCSIVDLTPDWKSYPIQEALSKSGSPSEKAIKSSICSINSDISFADIKILNNRCNLLSKALDVNFQSPNTVSVDNYSKMENLDLFE